LLGPVLGPGGRLSAQYNVPLLQNNLPTAVLQERPGICIIRLRSLRDIASGANPQKAKQFENVPPLGNDSRSAVS
ncbi:MAG: hypothetical protein Q8P55_01895, partial [bacterium]|nr:hypothetical protein [bacterium]